VIQHAGGAQYVVVEPEQPVRLGAKTVRPMEVRHHSNQG
jgi:hypothetical protein